MRENEGHQVVRATLDLLTPFLGTWKGHGRGGYPTLDAFEYSETLRVYQVPGAYFLAYEQSTDLVDPAGHPIRGSHWESGILRPLEDGSIELACVQGSGRVEVLRGTSLINESYPGLISLQFQSQHVGNDERVGRTSREWFLTDNHLSYIMKMTTTRVEALTLHLEASLFR